MQDIISISQDIWKDASKAFESEYESSQTHNMEFAVSICMKNRILNLPLEKDKFDFVSLNSEQCPSCLNHEVNIIHKDATLVCIRCGMIIKTNLVDGETNSCILATSVKQTCNTKKKRSYVKDCSKRKTHFYNWLQRIQGREVMTIKVDDIYFLKEFLIQKCPLETEWDYSKIRNAIKLIKRPRLLNHIFYLLKVLCNKPLVEFSSYHEDILLDMFIKIQDAFDEFKGTRINMLSYSYLLRKFTEIQGWTSLSDQIPYVKSHTKLYNLDIIWKKICKKVGYRFIKSVN